MRGDNNLTNSQEDRQLACPQGNPSANQTNCLIVDDDESFLRVMARALERCGYWTLKASCAEEALDQLEKHDVEVVVTDVHMPGMDGLTLLGRIRDRWPDVAVVVATGMTEVDLAVSCLRGGAHDFITKPFQIVDVRARIEQALEKRALILENKRYQLELEGRVEGQAARIEELFLEGVQSLADALDAKDAYTRGHSARVALYAKRMAKELGLPEADVQLIELGAALHDIGKIGVTDDILLKPGKLEKHEYEALMEHTVIGAHILGNLLKNAPEALTIVRSHHERLDGGGFPDRLEAHQIPMHVRIVTVADSFDAMTTARVYRKAMDTKAAFDELQRCAGTQFDQDVVDAMNAAFPPDTHFPLQTPQKVRLQLPHTVTGT